MNLTTILNTVCLMIMSVMTLLTKLRLLPFKVRVSEGCHIPRWYGIAYFDVCSLYAVCCPIPFNLIVRYGFRLYCWAKNCNNTPLERELRKAYLRGYRDGEIKRFVESL